MANSGSNTVSLLLGSSSGTFGTATSLSVGTTPKAVAVADLNRDGKDDLLVTSGGTNAVQVLLSQ